MDANSTGVLAMNIVAGPVLSNNFFDPKTGYCILRIKDQKTNDIVSVKGYYHDSQNASGRFLKAIGNWHEDSLRADVIYPPSLEKLMPHIEDIFDGRYYPALSRQVSRELQKQFGQSWKERIIKDPNAMKEINLPEKRRQSVIASWGSMTRRLRPYAILRNLNFSHKQAMNCLDALGSKADQKIFKRPYILKMISGVGFKKADKIALGLGIEPESDHRKKQFMINAVEALQNQGNTYIDIFRLHNLVKKDISTTPGEIANMIREAKILDYRMYNLPEIGAFAAKASMVNVEKEIAHMISKRLSSKAMNYSIPNPVSPFPLDPEQKEAVKRSCNNKISVITGGPGTGKTTIVKEVANALKHNRSDENIQYAALAGQAARRLTESTGEVALTVNSLLGMKPGGRPKKNEQDPLSADTVIIDETTMVDVFMFRDLLRAIREDARIIFVCDVDQLPSIGPGAVARDLISSGVVPTTRLKKSNRFDAGSDIAKVTSQINQGESPDWSAMGENDLSFVESEGEDKILEEIVHSVKNKIKSGTSPDDIQVLTPQVVSGLGTTRLNGVLRPIMNFTKNPESVNVFGTRFFVGDRITQTNRNDYDNKIMNGDKGKIVSIRYDQEERSHIIGIEFNDERGVVEINRDAMGSIKHGYAVTFHKSQGSEYPHVIMPMFSGHQFMMDKEMLYTAMTRSQKSCSLVGEPSVIDQALKNRKLKERNTLLSFALKRSYKKEIQNPEKSVRTEKPSCHPSEIAP